MKAKYLLTLAVAGIIACSACSSYTKPLYTPSTIITSTCTNDQVKEAILDSLIGRKWLVDSNSGNTIDASLYKGDIVVRIEINYSNSSYSINYISSQNMKAQDGVIHNKYNHWVNNLDNDIRYRLGMPLTKPSEYL